MSQQLSLKVTINGHIRRSFTTVREARAFVDGAGDDLGVVVESLAVQVGPPLPPLADTMR